MWSTENELQDREKDSEILTMEIFSLLASSILKYLQFTWDSPNNNATGTMPVLDTQMWVGLEAREWGLPEGMPGLDKLKLPTKIDSLKRIILYKFYRKPVATKTPMNARSAQPQQMKMQTATNELLERFKTTSR